MYSFFAEIARMRHIRRWSLMRNTQSENIQEHSHMAAVIAHALAVISNRYFGGTSDPGAVAVFALYHDSAEIFTGDLPTPVKYYNNEIRSAYSLIERNAEEKLISHLPEELRDVYRPLICPSDDKIIRFVSAADKICALIKCIEELSAGNNEFSAAKRQALEKINRLDMPEAKFFIERFLPAFYLTLDELEEL